MLPDLESSKFKLLTNEQELALVAAVKFGDKAAASRLVKQYSAYVRKRVHRLNRVLKLDHEDLFAEGSMGLLHSTSKFDPSRGIKFLGYATFWIDAYIKRYIANNKYVAKVAATQHCKFKEDPHDKELRSNCITPLALDSLVHASSSSEASTPHVERLIAEGPGVDELFEIEEDALFAKTTVDGVLARMPETDRFILRSRYLQAERASLSDLSAVMGFTRERVRQLELRALKKFARLNGSTLTSEEIRDNLRLHFSHAVSANEDESSLSLASTKIGDIPVPSASDRALYTEHLIVDGKRYCPKCRFILRSDNSGVLCWYCRSGIPRKGNATARLAPEVTPNDCRPC